MEQLHFKKEWFDEWFSSPYYERLYASRDEEEAEAFLRRLISFLQPKPQSRMLDIACGKGRYSRVLADMGFDVTGIDLSLPFIEKAKKQEKNNLHFFTHDMRLPFRDDYFDYVLNFFTSFGYFNSFQEHYDALNTFTTSLRQHGIIVLDYLNVPYTAIHLIRNEIKESGSIAFHIKRWQDESRFYKQVDVHDRENSYSHSFTEKVLKFTLPDFREMFAWHRLDIKYVFGDYHLNNYSETGSPRLIIIAEK